MMNTRWMAVLFGVALLVLTAVPTFAATGYAIGG
jgi:hypothetical protein